MVSRNFELLSRNVELLSRNFQLLSRNFELLSRNFKIKKKKKKKIPGPNTLPYSTVSSVVGSMNNHDQLQKTGG